MSPPDRCETALTRPESVRRRDGSVPASAPAPNRADRTRPVACGFAASTLLRLNEAACLIAQRKLLDLAGRGHWQLLQYLEALGDLVDGNAAIILQIVGQLAEGRCFGPIGD